MPNPQDDEARFNEADREAGDELVRRLLKTPPDPKKASAKRKVPPKIGAAKKVERSR